MNDNNLETFIGGELKIAGWVQYVNESKEESCSLRIETGCGHIFRQWIGLDISGDELIQWCKQHNHEYTDMRNRKEENA